MQKSDILVILLFFIVIIITFYSLYKINQFMPILKTCDDDFAVINKCGCVPCSWKDSNKYNRNTCFKVNLINISNAKSK